MKRWRQWIMNGVLAVISMFLVASVSLGMDITDVGQGSLRAIEGESGDPVVLDLPLKHTSVYAYISGYAARVTVEQRFANDRDHAVEAVYVFPLPDNAAVDAMTMHIGDRVIKGVIMRREEARQVYQKAKEEGRTAALLDQERPNIFTQSVTNILPGDDIRIEISYVQDLKYDDGEYEFNFPMVVGPRFIPGTPSGRKGGGWSPDTDKVPDASRITPPVLRPNERSGHDIDLTVELDAGLPIRRLRCPSHRIVKRAFSDTRLEIKLDAADTIPNKDFILRYEVAGPVPESALLTHAGERGRFFTLMIQPPVEVDVGDVTPKEMVFVVDCSGSMSGAPIAKAKAAMKKCIAGMNPDDSFQIIRFSSSASKFSPVPLPNTPANVSRGLAYIEAMKGGGGTMMIEGIKAALRFPPDPSRMRIVLFMTDGYIGNETEILSAVKTYLGNARLFSFGVGTSVNHYLLNRMAEVGRGFVQYVRPDEDTAAVVERFYRRIRNPLLTDIRIDWNGLDVKDVYPAVIPDLFDAQPVILHGRYDEPGKAVVTVRGLIRGRPWMQRIEVVFPEDEPDNDALASLWARARIKALMGRMYHGEKPDIVKEVTELALRFRLMSRYTSFVAVSEEVRRSPDGRVETVQVPVPMPDMVRYEGVFGKESGGSLLQLRSLGYSVSSEKRKRIYFSKPVSAAPHQFGGKAVTETDEGKSGLTGVTPPRKNTAATLNIKVRALTGKALETKVKDAFITVAEDVKRIMKKSGIRKAVFRIKTDAGGGVLSVEWLDREGGDDISANRLKAFLKKHLAFDFGKSEVTVELLM